MMPIEPIGLVIDGNTPAEHLDAGGRGCEPVPYGYGDIPGIVAAGERIELIPESEWPDRVAYLDKTGGWLEDLIRPWCESFNQGRTNLCWVNGPALMAMCARELMGLGRVRLSPAGLAYSITGGQNVGGSPDAAIRQLAEYGIPDVAHFPANDFSGSQAVQGWKQNALLHRMPDWIDGNMPRQVWQFCVTMTLQARPYIAAYSWWKHLITGGFRARYVNGRLQLRKRNSWGDTYGENGFFWMGQEQGTPDWGCIGAGPMTVSRL